MIGKIKPPNVIRLGANHYHIRENFYFRKNFHTKVPEMLIKVCFNEGQSMSFVLVLFDIF